MGRQKSLRIDVHHANGVVREPVYRTHLDHVDVDSPERGVAEHLPSRVEVGVHQRAERLGDVVVATP